MNLGNYDAWKTRSPDDELQGYLCRGCDNVMPSPHMACDECLEVEVAEDALLEFYLWEPWP